jgi:hypothetical protein
MTTKLPATYYLPLWEQAHSEEIGILIRCVSPDHQRLLVNALYECRKQTGGFDHLIIFQPHPPGTIYIAHKTTELPE